MTYRTSDFPLICYLHYLGYEIAKIEDEDERRKIFVFADDEVGGKPLSEHVDDFYNRRARVDPKFYDDSIRAVKSMLYNRGGFSKH